MIRKRVELKLPRGTIIPDHIAMILDGNRRWARAKGLKPWEGHKAGYEAVIKIARTSRELGVHTFTIWAFSTENWSRPKVEIDKIMSLLRRGLKEFSKEADKEGVRLIHLGRKDRFPKDVVKMLSEMEEATKNNTKNILNLALDYGGRDEILRTVKKIVKDKIPVEKIDEKLFSSYLDTDDQPYPNPDLFIRTSGEQRTSGYLPWQLVYAEFYFERDHLPDFTPEKLKNAIIDYSRRRRRFGGNDMVEHLQFKPKVSASLEIAWSRLSKIPEGERLRDFAMEYLKEQYGLSKKLAKEAAYYMLEAVKERNKKDWVRAKVPLKEFYRLIKNQVKLTFEPEIVASLRIKLWQGLRTDNILASKEALEDTARDLVAEQFRISGFQASKAAHLRVLAETEMGMASGKSDLHWERAEDYLQKYYKALKERVA